MKAVKAFIDSAEVVVIGFLEVREVNDAFRSQLIRRRYQLIILEKWRMHGFHIFF